MSPARLHRDRVALLAASAPTAIVLSGEGGQPAAPASPVAPVPADRLSAAAAHRLGSAVVATAGDAAQAAPAPAPDPATAQIRVRLVHDLRRLKDIQSMQMKIAAKVEMLPQYWPWIDAALAAADAAGVAVTEEVVAVTMVWAIDTGDWPRAMQLAAYVLCHRVPLPARYQRSAPALIVEEVAEAALRAQAAGDTFPLAVLEEVEHLTDGEDMHDEIRAKLLKAVGTELARGAADAAGDALLPTVDRAIDTLTRAQGLHDRVGVKTLLRDLKKTRTATVKAAEGATEPAKPDDAAPETDTGHQAD